MLFQDSLYVVFHAQNNKGKFFLENVKKNHYSHTVQNKQFTISFTLHELRQACCNHCRMRKYGLRNIVCRALERIENSN